MYTSCFESIAKQREKKRKKNRQNIKKNIINEMSSFDPVLGFDFDFSDVLNIPKFYIFWMSCKVASISS